MFLLNLEIDLNNTPEYLTELLTTACSAET